MNHISIFTLVILCNSICFGQKLSPDDIDQLANTSMYKVEMVNNYIQTNKEAVGVIVGYNSDYYFPEIFTKQTINKILSTIKESAKLDLRHENNFFDKYFLELTCDILSNLSDPRDHLLKVSIHKLNMFNGSDTILLDRTSSNTSNYESILLNVGLSKIDTTKSIVGNGEFIISFPIGFDEIELSLDDIGKTFILNDVEYRLNTIKDNYVAIEEQIVSSDFQQLNLINFISETESIYLDDNKSNKTNAQNANPQFKPKEYYKKPNILCNRNIFEEYLKNPKISKDQFVKIINNDFQNKYLNIYCHIISSSENIGSKVKIFTPVYQKEKIIIEY